MRDEADALEDTGPGDRWAVRRRPSYRRANWLPQDILTAERYAGAVVEGRFRSVSAAAPSCQSELTGRHTLSAVQQRLRLLTRALGRSWLPLPWTREEKAVVDRFARAIVEGRYRSVKQTLPECQHELGQVAPESPRTDTAVAWRVLCRAYDLGLPRRRHSFTAQESRLLDRYVSAMVRGVYPDVPTVIRRYQRACERAGITARRNNVICGRIVALARSKGCEPVRAVRPLSPAETRIVNDFSLALARNEYRHGTAAAADCLRALADAGFSCRRSARVITRRIRAGAREMGWTTDYGQWSARDMQTIRRFAQALAAGRYPTIAAACRACRMSLAHAGRLEPEDAKRLVWRLRKLALDAGGKQFRPRWKPDELRIVDRFARALIRGEYATPSAARAECRCALDLAGFTEHRGKKGMESKFRHRVHDIRRYNAWLRQHRTT